MYLAGRWARAPVTRRASILFILKLLLYLIIKINDTIIYDTMLIGFPANKTFREKMQKYTKIFVCISQTFSRNFAFFRENKWSENEAWNGREKNKKEKSFRENFAFFAKLNERQRIYGSSRVATTTTLKRFFLFAENPTC